MAVITIKPKDVVIPFDLTVMLGRKLQFITELEKFNETVRKESGQNKEKKT